MTETRFRSRLSEQEESSRLNKKNKKNRGLQNFSGNQSNSSDTKRNEMEQDQDEVTSSSDSEDINPRAKKSGLRLGQRNKTPYKVSLDFLESTNDTFTQFEEKFHRYVIKYQKDTCVTKLIDFTYGLKKQFENSNQAFENSKQAAELYEVALSLGPINEKDPEHTQQHKEKMRLASYCIASTLAMSSPNEPHKNLFLHATLGATNADPQKWSAWKIILFSMFIAILSTLLLTGSFSIAYAVIHMGTNAASTMSVWHLFQAGWVDMLPYKYLIPMCCTLISSITTGYFFEKTETERRMSRLQNEIQPNGEGSNNSPYPESTPSLGLLNAAIDDIENPSLKENLKELSLSLYHDHSDFIRKAPAFQNYLNPIIFATTAFARSVVENQNNPSPLTDDKKNLLFHAVMGASLVERPNESWFLSKVTPWIPALIIMSILFVAFTPAFFIGYISLNGMFIASPLFSLLSLLPSNQTESTLSNRIKNYFIPDPIKKTVFSIEKILANSGPSASVQKSAEAKEPSRKNSSDSSDSFNCSSTFVTKTLQSKYKFHKRQLSPREKTSDGSTSFQEILRQQRGGKRGQRLLSTSDEKRSPQCSPARN